MKWQTRDLQTKDSRETLMIESPRSDWLVIIHLPGSREERNGAGHAREGTRHLKILKKMDASGSIFESTLHNTSPAQRRKERGLCCRDLKISVEGATLGIIGTDAGGRAALHYSGSYC